MQDARVSIDPQKSADEQVKEVVERLRSVIPLKSEQVVLTVSIPAQFSSASYSVLKSLGTLKAADWLPNGSLKAILEISAAGRQTVIDRLNQINPGDRFCGDGPMSEKRRHVIPGDVVTTGPYRAEQNTVLDGRLIVSTAVGVTEISDGAARVIPLTGKYMPRIDDMVVGKVTTHTSLAWELDINSCYVGFLPASDVFGRDFSARSDELNTRLKKGDMVAARIANSDRSRDPLLTIVDRDLGKIDSGEMVEISASKIPRLIGKRGTMIQMIEAQTDSMITVGQNGWVVVACEDPNGLIRAKKAIRMVDRLAHVHSLTDKVRNMLEAEK